VSLLLDGDRPLALAPAYDLLPMHYRPTEAGEIVERPFEVAVPPPRQRPAWSKAAAMTVAYWEWIGVDPSVSDGFRAEARANGEAVKRVAERIGAG
jgi:hypothetical protein